MLASLRRLSLAVGLGLVVLSRVALAADYYVDSRAGDDTHDGHSSAQAWRSTAKVNTTTFAPGDRVLLRAGSEWEGVTLHPLGSGTAQTPIALDRYGDGPAPALHGLGRVPCVLLLDNQEGWDIANLELTNHTDGAPQRHRAIEIRAHNFGWVHHIHLKNLLIHDVNAVSDYHNDGDTVAKSFGGLATIIEGETQPTAWDDLRVEYCTFRDVGPMGMVMLSSWMAGHRTNDPKSWFPGRGVVVRGCTFERVARNGLLVRGCAAPLIEHNFFRECGLLGSGNAMFVFHCDDALIQYNESCFTKYNPGDSDASGFDSDYNCRRSVFQYNYSHDNDYGFILLCSLGGRAQGFNDGTIVRYNISQNDGGNLVRVSGTVTHAQIYNNTFYAKRDMANPRNPGDPPRIFFCKDWNGWSDGISFFNNIVYSDCPAAIYEPGQGKNNLFAHNLLFGQHPASEPADAHKVTGDPRFAHPGGAGLGWASAVAAYTLQPGSPAIAAGVSPTATGGDVDMGAVPFVPRTADVSPARGAVAAGTAMPLTYCNPLPLPEYQSGVASEKKPGTGRWMTDDVARDYRSMADPCVIRFRDRWYLFPSNGLLWYSSDLVHWTHHDIEPHSAGWAPSVIEFRGWLYLTGNGSSMWRARDPLGPWEKLGPITDERGQPTTWRDPCFFLDDDGTLYCYNGLGTDGIYVVKLNPDDPTHFAGPRQPCFAFNPDHLWERFGEHHEDPTKSSIEGAWITKHAGKYYLQYSAPGTIFRDYAVGCYIGDTATGPWHYQQRNPILLQRGGLINGTAHHCVVTGPDGNLWCFYTLLVRIEHGFERRIGMDPVGFDARAEMFVNGPSETPQFAPGVKPNPWHDNDAGLANVNSGWQTKASSYIPGHEPALAVDDNIRTWWEAADATKEQWLSVNLERPYEVSAARTMFADRGLDYAAGVRPGPYRYRIEGSLDGKVWFTLLDKSGNTVDQHIEYDTWPARPAKQVRLVVLSAPMGMRLGVWEFSVFGRP